MARAGAACDLTISCEDPRGPLPGCFGQQATLPVSHKARLATPSIVVIVITTLMDRAASASACTMAAIAGLHAAWGFGSAFPFRDRASLADTVAGLDAVPAPPECFAVAVALTTAGALVADVLPLSVRARTTGVVGVAAILGSRGLAGVLGRTADLVPWTPSPRFVAIDRRYYGPLCLSLAAGALASLRR